jgi:hypothetical protein
MPLPLQSTFVHNSVEVINRLGDGCISASILIPRARKLLVISEHRNTGELQSPTVARWPVKSRQVIKRRAVELSGTVFGYPAGYKNRR